MIQTVGIEELQGKLTGYMQQVKAGNTLTITESGEAIGQITPLPVILEDRLQHLSEAGIIIWSGKKLTSLKSTVQAQGDQTVADLLLENRE
ncbi:MAG TPA: hypothetical protein G4N96_04730 [Chloroflexi bacterium]|nr:MAG: hypothetical protein B6243_04570 [Anaerolineaceae bacterium 4572_5.2]HEY84406.1 hypothetical protein [Chloroflexota bacterium]